MGGIISTHVSFSAVLCFGNRNASVSLKSDVRCKQVPLDIGLCCV